MSTLPEQRTALLTVKEAAAELRVSPTTVYRLIADRRLDVIDIAMGGRPRLRISRAALGQFIDTMSERAAS